MDDSAFFDRAILASAAGPSDDDAVRQLRALFTPHEFAAWQASKSAPVPVAVPVGHDEERDLYWACWGDYGIEGTSRDSYPAALEDLRGHVLAWAAELRDSGGRLGETPALMALVSEVDATLDDDLLAYLLVRATFDTGSLSFRIAEFVEEDGSAAQRAVPFADGEPPAEVDLPVDGRVVTYQGDFRGDAVVYSPVGRGPSIVSTQRQEEPTSDFDAEFPRAGLRPDDFETP